MPAEIAREPFRGEARLGIEGGLAHFPGLAAEQVIAFDLLDAAEREELASLVDEADFFNCRPAQAAVRPDARTYSIHLAIGDRSRALRIAEPIGDPALARLVTRLHRTAQRLAVAAARAD